MQVCHVSVLSSLNSSGPNLFEAVFIFTFYKWCFFLYRFFPLQDMHRVLNHCSKRHKVSSSLFSRALQISLFPSLTYGLDIGASSPSQILGPWGGTFPPKKKMSGGE